MPKFEFRFDLATILLASVLTVLGISAANAGGARGGVVNQSAGAASNSAAAVAGGSGHQASDRAGAKPLGGARGGIVETR